MFILIYYLYNRNKGQNISKENKRTALHSMYVYLIINGFDITATQQDAENMIIDVASGNMTNTELAQWLRENTVEIDVN